jgi:hypothetical protein
MQLFAFFIILAVLALAPQDTSAPKAVDDWFSSYPRCSSDSEDASCAVRSNVESVTIF